MYFPLGTPRVYAASHFECSSGIIAMARSPDGQWLATLTDSSLFVWSARQHRVVLGHYPRHPSSLDSDGPNVRLCWHPDSHSLAISTLGSFVYLYQVQEASRGSGPSGHEQPSGISADDCARLLHGQFRVSISLTQKVQAAVQEGAATGALAASSTHFWLGVARGVLLAIDWSAQDPTPRKLHLRPPAEIEDRTHSDAPAAVVNVCCSPEMRLVVGLDADGLVGYSFGAEECSGRFAANADPLFLPKETGSALAISVNQRLLCIGCTSGSLLLFRIDVPQRASTAAAVGAMRLERKLTLSPWGINPEECGAAIAVDWSDDGLGLAALWSCRSRPGIWSPQSGACTFIPPANELGAAPPLDTDTGVSLKGRGRPMPCALAWADNGLALWTALSVKADGSDEPASVGELKGANGGLLAESLLVQPCASRGPCQNEAARRCFYAHDRVLMLTQHNLVVTECQPASSTQGRSTTVTKAVAAVETQFNWHELAVPWKYLADNWPIRHVSASADGTQLAVSGARGLTLLDLRTKRWRVFGDVTQERELDCVGLAWFRHIVIVYAVTEQQPVQENIWGDSRRQKGSSSNVVQLHLYPRKHLDRSSRLFSPALLPAQPHCVDVDEQTGVLATLCTDGSLILHQLWLQRDEGHDSPNYTRDNEAMALRAVTVLAESRLDWVVSSDLGDLAVQKMRLAPGALVLPCPSPHVSTLTNSDASLQDALSEDDSWLRRAASTAREARAVQMDGSAAASVASLCLILSRDGQFTLYDATSGVRLCISTNVADFWLTPTSTLPFQGLTALPLLWYADPMGRLSVCRAGDLAKDWVAAVATYKADTARTPTDPGGARSTVLSTWHSVHSWGGEQDASEAWTVGLSEHYGVLLRVSAPHWSSCRTSRSLDRVATSAGGYGDTNAGLVIHQSPVLHRLFESLLNPNGDGDARNHIASATAAAQAACVAICQRCSPAWPSLAASLEWLLHGALETIGTKAKTPIAQFAHPHETTNPMATVDGRDTLLSHVLEVLRCHPKEYEGIVGRCARTMDPAYWVPLFQEPPYGAGQPSILFEACLRHNPPQLRSAAHYLIILQTTLPSSGCDSSLSHKWQDYPPRLVELALAAGDYTLVTEVLQFLRRAEAYASAAAASEAATAATSATVTDAVDPAAPPPRRSAFGRAPSTQQETNPLEMVPDTSPASVDNSAKATGWLEFLGFGDSSSSTSDTVSVSTSAQHSEPAPQLQQIAGVRQLDHEEPDGDLSDRVEVKQNEGDTSPDSLIQTRIVPLVEAHGLGLLRALRLSELVYFVGALAGTSGALSSSEFELSTWLRRLYTQREQLTVGAVEDFGAAFQQVATAMINDRRQRRLFCAQRPGNVVVAVGGVNGATAPDTHAVRELGHCLAAAGWVDLGLLLSTVCGDADGAAEILRVSAPQGYDRYDAYASGLLRFVLGQTQANTAPDATAAVATPEAERRVVAFLDRLTAQALPTGEARPSTTGNAPEQGVSESSQGDT